jgi:hypothetical protein
MKNETMKKLNQANRVLLIEKLALYLIDQKEEDDYLTTWAI